MSVISGNPAYFRTAILHRDIQVAVDVGKKAKLGYFDVEFTMYGCAFLDGEMKYKISPNKEDIYIFIGKANLQNIYPSNVMEYTEKCPVPSGMREFIAQDVKVRLARKLKETYDEAYFISLKKLSEVGDSNCARELLLQKTEELEGLFDEAQLKEFENLIEYFYTHKCLNQASYDELKVWLAEERKSMEDNIIITDIFEKTFYGLCYEENGDLKYKINTLCGSIYEKMFEAETAGKFVLPIFTQTRSYNLNYRLNDVKEDFTRLFHQKYTDEYKQCLKNIRTNASATSQKTFESVLEAVKCNYSSEAKDTLLRYGHRWGMIKCSGQD